MKTEDLLERFYEPIIKEGKNDYQFFVYLADYVSFVKENQKTKGVIEKILKQKELDRKNFIRITKDCTEELLDAEEGVVKIIKKECLLEQNEKIKNSVEDLKNYKNGSLKIFHPLPEFLHHRLFEIGIGLSVLNKKELLGKYNKDNSEKKNKYGNFVFSEKYELYLKEKKLINDVEEVSFWNGWENLNLVWSAIYNDNLKKQDTDCALLIINDMLQVKRNAERPSNNKETNFIFKKEDYKGYLSRIHLFLLKELSKEDQDFLKYKFPFKLPAGTDWKHITFKFNDNETVNIEVKGCKHFSNFREMGFLGKGKKNLKPSHAWELLRVFAGNNGELSGESDKAKDKYKKQKQILSEKLKAYFNLDSDPFHPYEEESSYRIKMTLIPSLHEESLSKINYKNKNEDEENEFDSFYNEQTNNR